jgi:hypothetical protein
MYLVKIESEGCHHDSGYMLSDLEDISQTVFMASKVGSEPSFEWRIPENIDAIIKQSLFQDDVPLFGNSEYPLLFRLELGSNQDFRRHYELTHPNIEPKLVDYQMGFHRYSLSVFDLSRDADVMKLVDDNRLTDKGVLTFIPGDSVVE